MQLSDWIAREGRGSVTRLMRETGLAYTTIHYAARGEAISQYDTAKRISVATGGEVSIKELCEPATHSAPAATGTEG